MPGVLNLLHNVYHFEINVVDNSKRTFSCKLDCVTVVMQLNLNPNFKEGDYERNKFDVKLLYAVFSDNSRVATTFEEDSEDRGGFIDHRAILISVCYNEFDANYKLDVHEAVAYHWQIMMDVLELDKLFV
jgi:hypothetical protein